MLWEGEAQSHTRAGSAGLEIIDPVPGSPDRMQKTAWVEICAMVIRGEGGCKCSERHTGSVGDLETPRNLEMLQAIRCSSRSASPPSSPIGCASPSNLPLLNSVRLTKLFRDASV